MQNPCIRDIDPFPNAKLKLYKHLLSTKCLTNVSNDTKTKILQRCCASKVTCITKKGKKKTDAKLYSILLDSEKVRSIELLKATCQGPTKSSKWSQVAVNEINNIPTHCQSSHFYLFMELFR